MLVMILNVELTSYKRYDEAQKTSMAHTIDGTVSTTDTKC